MYLIVTSSLTLFRTDRAYTAELLSTAHALPTLVTSRSHMAYCLYTLHIVFYRLCLKESVEQATQETLALMTSLTLSEPAQFSLKMRFLA